MRRATITEAKNGLSALLDQVRAGETILILDRGIPVARLEPVTRDAASHDGRVERLVRAGLARAPLHPLPPDFLTRPLPKPRASVVAALLEERREDR